MFREAIGAQRANSYNGKAKIWTDKITCWGILIHESGNIFQAPFISKTKWFAARRISPVCARARMIDCNWRSKDWGWPMFLQGVRKNIVRFEGWMWPNNTNTPQLDCYTGSFIVVVYTLKCMLVHILLQLLRNL